MTKLDQIYKEYDNMKKQTPTDLFKASGMEDVEQKIDKCLDDLKKLLVEATLATNVIKAYDPVLRMETELTPVDLAARISGLETVKIFLLDSIRSKGKAVNPPEIV